MPGFLTCRVQSAVRFPQPGWNWWRIPFWTIVVQPVAAVIPPIASTDCKRSPFAASPLSAEPAAGSNRTMRAMAPKIRLILVSFISILPFR